MEDLERFEGCSRFKAGAALEVDWSSRVLWEVQHPDHHHDARRLRNGNVLLLCLRPVPDASRARIRGGVPDTETPAGIYGDYLVERGLTHRPAVSPLRAGPTEIQAVPGQLQGRSSSRI